MASNILKLKSVGGSYSMGVHVREDCKRRSSPSFSLLPSAAKLIILDPIHKHLEILQHHHKAPLICI